MNREIIKILIDIILYLGHHNIAFRGHKEDRRSTLKGNFRDLCSLLSKYSPTLSNYIGQLEKMRLNKRSRYSFISCHRQHDLINSISKFIKLKIFNAIKKSKFFSISIVSAFGLSHKEQISFIFRYIDEDTLEIKERLLSLRDTPKTTGKNLFDIFKEVCETHCLDWTNYLIGQSYDGGSKKKSID